MLHLDQSEIVIFLRARVTVAGVAGQVDVVHRNLLLADWNDEDHVESLLNSKNSKLSREMLKNVRLSCCVAGNCNLLVNEEDVKSTLELVADHQVTAFQTPRVSGCGEATRTHVPRAESR